MVENSKALEGIFSSNWKRLVIWKCQKARLDNSPNGDTFWTLSNFEYPGTEISLSSGKLQVYYFLYELRSPNEFLE